MSIIPQRELKFRAWIGHTMIQVVEMNFLKDSLGNKIGFVKGYFISGPNKGTHTSASMDKAKIIQYVGLDDKNKKPIYEGDVLEFPSHLHSFYSSETVKAVVYLNEYAEISAGGWLLNKINRHADKIGNIYETPELLEGVPNE